MPSTVVSALSIMGLNNSNKFIDTIHFAAEKNQS